jgi:hypothetical protein
MTAADLIIALQTSAPTRRIVLPAQEWGWSELAGVHAPILTFADRCPVAWRVGVRAQLRGRPLVFALRERDMPRKLASRRWPIGHFLQAAPPSEATNKEREAKPDKTTGESCKGHADK